MLIQSRRCLWCLNADADVHRSEGTGGLSSLTRNQLQTPWVCALGGLRVALTAFPIPKVVLTCMQGLPFLNPRLLSWGPRMCQPLGGAGIWMPKLGATGPTLH